MPLSSINHPWNSKLPKRISWIYLIFSFISRNCKNMARLMLSWGRGLLIWSGPSIPLRITRDCRFPNSQKNGVADCHIARILNHWSSFFTWSLRGDLRSRKGASIFWTPSCIGWGQKRLQLNSSIAFHCDREDNGESPSPVAIGKSRNVSKPSIKRLGNRLPRQTKAWI